MILNFINIEDAQGQCLRIRCADMNASGLVEFERAKYAVPPDDTAEEKTMWASFAEILLRQYRDSGWTDEAREELRKQCKDFVSVEYDPDAGELTLKENTTCQTSSTERNISIQPNSSKPTTSKKAKPSSKSKPSRK